jgi:hypothetical protein
MSKSSAWSRAGLMALSLFVVVGLAPTALWAAEPSYQCEAQKTAAEEGENEFTRLPSPRVVEFSLGVKVGGGAELWTTPSNTTLYVNPITQDPFDMPFFDETRAGYNIAFGLFGEVRFVQYVGIEAGLFFVRHKLLEDTDWTYPDPTLGATVYRNHSEQTLTFTKLRVPILLKGYLPVSPKVRLSLGVGPEFSWGLYSSATFKIDKKLKGNHASFTTLKTQNVDDIGLVVATGIVIDAGVVKVPIELRFSYNFSQPAKYNDRVTYDQISPAGFPTTATIIARDSLYAQLLLGVLYDL